MRLLAVEVTPDEVRIARGERRFGALRSLGVERRQADDDATRGAVLARAARWRPHVVLTALPAARVTHRVLTLPFHDRRRVRRTAPLELLGQLPLDPEDAVVACATLGRAGGEATVLGAVARRADIDAVVRTLAAAGIAPARIDLAPLPVWNLVPGSDDTALLLADGTRSALMLRRGAQIAGLRALATSARDVAGLAAEVRWSLAALGGAPRLVLVGADASAALAETVVRTLAIPVTTLGGNHGDHVSACAVPAGLLAGAVRRTAVGLTLGSAPPADGGGLRRIAALALVALVLGGIDLGLLRAGLARRDARLVAAMRAETAAVLPDARIVAPRAQLEAALAATARRRVPGPVLDVLRDMSARTPAALRVDLDEVAIDGDRVLLHGRCEGFEAVDVLRRALATSPLLADVTAEETRAAVDGRRVEFRLRATRRAPGETSS